MGWGASLASVASHFARALGGASRDRQALFNIYSPGEASSERRSEVRASVAQWQSDAFVTHRSWVQSPPLAHG